MPGLRQSNLNRMSPAAKKAGLGDVIADLVAQVNALTTKHNALCAKLDTANVAGISNNNAAQVGVVATTILDLESRPTTT